MTASQWLRVAPATFNTVSRKWSRSEPFSSYPAPCEPEKFPVTGVASSIRNSSQLKKAMKAKWPRFPAVKVSDWRLTRLTQLVVKPCSSSE